MILSTKTGELYSGVFAGATTDGQDPTYLLKMVRQIKTASKSSVNGTADTAIDYIGVGADHSMSFGILDVAGMFAENVTDAASTASQDSTLVNHWVVYRQLIWLPSPLFYVPY